MVGLGRPAAPHAAGFKARIHLDTVSSIHDIQASALLEEEGKTFGRNSRKYSRCSIPNKRSSFRLSMATVTPGGHRLSARVMPLQKR